MRERYFQRYPENLARQLEIRRTVQDTGVLVGPVGNTRRFLGRLWEDDVQREALAQTQQATVVWMLNLALWRVWYELDGRLNIGAPPRPSDPNRVWLLGQVHDALLGLVRPGDFAALQRVREIMECPVLVHGTPVRIGVEVAVGKSWLHADLKAIKWAALDATAQ
jgi:DNA polymerase I-like protein with 3'-5' exonuclease and polymerase domains